MKTLRLLTVVCACLAIFNPSNGQENKSSETITIIQQPKDVTTCLGGDALFSIVAESDNKIYYDWIIVGEYYGTSDSATMLWGPAQHADTNKLFYCMVYDHSTSDTVWSDTVRFHIGEFPEISPRTINGPTDVSYSGYPEPYEIRHQESITEYIWKLEPANAGIIDFTEAGDSNISIIFSGDYTGSATLTAEMRQGGCKSLNTAPLNINVTGVPSVQEICIVGLDEETEKFRIVWNKSEDPKAMAYNIHRESNQAGQFLKIASIPADSEGVYVDSASAPYVVPHSYKISLVDSFNNESPLSPAHTTILLSSSLGTSGKHNLSWTHYIGHPFLTYEIYHGTSKNNMAYLDAVASTVNQYIVQDPLSLLAYYQIVARREGCNPVLLKKSTNYNETRSNINELVSSTKEIKIQQRILRISPNPAADKVQINYLGEARIYSDLELIDLVGKVYGSYTMSSKLIEINTYLYPEGIYLVRLKTSEGVFTQKLVIRH